MSELRIKLLELAIQAGATIENAQRVAADWERWATEDDPLRLGVPPIASLGHPNEIDWSRCQLVTNGLGLIIKTNGHHTEREFEGTVMNAGTSSHLVGHISDGWFKDVFTYHGEIPQEQPKKPQCANAKDGDGVCGLSCCICAKEGPKTTGLNFLEAIKLLTDEKVVTKRASWDEDAGHLYSDGSHLRDEEGDPYYGNSIENFLATDWQIVKS